MKKTKREGKTLIKTIMVATLIVGASTLIFQGLTQVVVAEAYNKTNIIPTNYLNCSDVTSPETLLEGYTKANYTVESIDLEYYQNNVPAQKDITQKEAAELVAQSLWLIYGANMEKQTIEMGYSPAMENLPRPTWTAHIEMKNKDYHDGYYVESYDVTIDSVTGVLLNIGMTRGLEAKVKAGPDSSIDESEFEAIAKELAEKYNIVHSDIESITCTGQGASFPTNTIETYGDPEISFEIKGTNGEVALMSISRYDKVLNSIMFNGSYKYSKTSNMALEEQMDIETQQDSITSDDDTQDSSLIMFENN
ncbi:MAG: hypothetical protein ACERKN_22565 [Velocimicrobium sp.]